MCQGVRRILYTHLYRYVCVIRMLFPQGVRRGVRRVYIYIYIYICVYVYMCVYIYIYREREREFWATEGSLGMRQGVRRVNICHFDKDDACEGRVNT